MRRVMWSSALAGLGFGSLTMVGGTAIGDGVGALAVGYGVLVVLAALYMIVGLAIRDRIGRRASAQRDSETAPSIDRLAGHRVF
ncbi:MAG TPA: hypothetical protein VLA59_06160 [Patescibacteria group bacterium]|nr:hypothetical protein [Patescibacteria group bacterium]